jgi:hypothetical protein
MEKVYKILAIIALALFICVTVGGSIWIQYILWKSFWWLAISHIVVIFLAGEPFLVVVRRLWDYIVNSK